jgi:hypothetical protein
VIASGWVDAAVSHGSLHRRNAIWSKFMNIVRLCLIVLGLSALSACVTTGPDADPGGPSPVNPDGSPVVGEARGY